MQYLLLRLPSPVILISFLEAYYKYNKTFEKAKSLSFRRLTCVLTYSSQSG